MAATAIKRVGYGQVEPNKLIGIKTGDLHNMLPLDDRTSTKVDVLQNGEFMFYDYASGYVTNTPTAMTMPCMVWNEIKIYEDWLALKDFAMFRVGDNYVTNVPAVGRVTSVPIDQRTHEPADVYGDGALTTAGGVDSEGNSLVVGPHANYGYRMDGICPRLVGTYIGDVFTTNMVGILADESLGATDTNMLKYEAGTVLSLRKTSRNTLELVPLANADTTLKTKIQYVIARDYTMPDGQRGFKVQRIA